MVADRAGDSAVPAGLDEREAARQAVPFVRKGLTSQSLYFSIEEVQSRMQLQHPDALDLRYTRTMMGFLRFLPAPEAIAMIGLGGGSLAKFCHRHLPKARIDVAELNPHVIALRDAFGSPRTAGAFASSRPTARASCVKPSAGTTSCCSMRSARRACRAR